MEGIEGASLKARSIVDLVYRAWAGFNFSMTGTCDTTADLRADYCNPVNFPKGQGDYPASIWNTRGMTRSVSNPAMIAPWGRNNQGHVARQ